MIIDCDRCTNRGRGCADCVVAVLLGPPEVRDDAVLDPDVRRAIDLFAEAGMLPAAPAAPRPVPAARGRGGRAAGSTRRDRVRQDRRSA